MQEMWSDMHDKQITCYINQLYSEFYVIQNYI